METIKNEMILRDEVCGLDKNRKIDPELFKKNIFLDAGAGSGKTFTIVERILNQFSIGVPPKEIVAITFTNKAAEELRNRITGKLQARIEQTKGYYENLRNAFEHIEEMQISTIHSFCQTLLKEYSYEIRLPNDLEVMEEEEETMISDRLFMDWVSQIDQQEWDSIVNQLDSRTTYPEFILRVQNLYQILFKLGNETRIIEDFQKLSREDLLKTKVLQLFCDLFYCMDPSTQLESFEQMIKYLNDHQERYILAPKLSKFFEAANNDGGVLDDFWKSVAEIVDFITAKPCETLIKYNVLAEKRQEENEKFKTWFADHKKELSALKKSKDEAEIDRIIEELQKMRKESIGRLLEYFSDFEKIEYNSLFTSASQKMADLMKGYTGPETDSKLKWEIFEALKPASFSYAKKKECGICFPKQYFDPLKTELIKHSKDLNIMLQKKKLLEEKLILRYAKKAKAYYQQNKPSHKIGNDSILIYTLELLKKNQELAEKIGSRYKTFYIDEYQDTDPIQEQIFWILATDFKKTGQIRDGALFMVGDPKQSIYRFRNADPSLFNKTKRKMQMLDNCRIVQFNINFRSNDLILGWVNDKFQTIDLLNKNAKTSYSKMLSKKPIPMGSGSWQYSRMIQEDSSQTVLAGVFRFETNHDGSSNFLSGMQDLITLVRALVESKKYRIYAFDRSQNALSRPIEYKDILILTPIKKYIPYLARQMRKADIPVRIAGQIDPSIDSILNAYVKMYSFLATNKYHDSLSKAAFEETLYSLFQIEDLDEFFAIKKYIVSELLAAIQYQSGQAMAYTLLEYFGYFLTENHIYTKSELEAGYLAIEQMLETVFKENTVSATKLASLFQSYILKNYDYEVGVQKEDHALCLMNCHKAKGLEGKIVIFADCIEKVNHRSLNGKAQKPFHVYDEEADEDRLFVNVRNGLHQDVIVQDQEENALENRRMEYVIATRAEQVLIFMSFNNERSCFNNDADNGISYDIDALAPIDLEIENQNREIKWKEYDFKEEKAMRSQNCFQNSMDELFLRYRSVSPSMFESHASIEKDVLNLDKEKVVERPSSNILGTTMHRALELFIKRHSFQSSYSGMNSMIEACVQQAILENKTEIELEALNMEHKDREMIYFNFLTLLLNSYSDWIDKSRLLEGVERFYTEYAFQFCENEDRGEVDLKQLLNTYRKDIDPCIENTIYMNGVADLILLREDGTLELYDYKSDNDFQYSEDRFVQKLEKSYRGQLEHYRCALSKLFNIEPHSIHLYLISFSQKDEEGNLLSNIRTRVTPIHF